MRPVHMQIALPLDETASGHRCIVLAQMQVHRGMGEIDQPARMVRIQVRHDNMPDVLWIEPQRLDLRPRSIDRIKMHCQLELIRLGQP